MAFSVTFDEFADESNIKLVVDRLIDDGWTVKYDKPSRQLYAENAIIKVPEPVVIQGPPDMEYMGEKAFDAWHDAITNFAPPEWAKIDSNERAAWIEVAKTLLK
jgi:hypothetical protein